MKFTTKFIYGLLVLIGLPLASVAQSNLKSESGYQASKTSGAMSSLMKWRTLKTQKGSAPVINPQQKVLRQLGINPANERSSTDKDYEFYAGEAYKGNNLPYAAITDSSGNTYVTGGSSNENQPSGDFFTLKIGVNGETLWEKREQAEMYAVEYGMQMAFDNMGNIIVSGLKWNGNDMDIRVIKYSVDGDKLWESTFNNGAEGMEIPNALTTGTDGSIYVTGITWSGSSVDYLTIKFNSSGSKEWHRTENPNGGETWNESTAITVDTNNNVLVTGFSPNTDGWLNYHTIKYDGHGAKLWEHGFNYQNTDPNNTSAVTNSTPYAIITDDDDNVYITGTFDTFLNRIGTVKYNESGELQWTKTYKNSTDETNGWKIAINDNTVYVEGSHSGGFLDDGTVLISYNTDGTQNWVQETNDLIQTSNGTLAFDAEGSIIISASGMTQGEEEWLQDVAARAYKYAPEGNLLGQSAFIISTTYGTASMGNMAGTGLDSEGNVYFSVNSYYTEKGNVFETVKSTFGSTSPSIKWSAQYANLGSPAATMLNTFADGKGNTFSTGTYNDYDNEILNNNYYVVKHDAEGSVAWEVVFNAENGNPAEGIIGRADAEGNVYLCLLPGYEVYPPSLKIIKSSPEGKQLWATKTELYSPAVYVMEPQADGSVYIGGTAYENEASQSASFLGVKFNADGTEAWKTYMPGIAGNNIVQVNAGKVDSKGQLILTGKHGSGNFMAQEANLTVIQFNADGSAGWIAPVVVEGETSSGTDLYLDPDGSIYVNGFTQNNTTYNQDILIAKINAAGEEVWSTIFGDAEKTERSYTVKPFSNGDIGIVGYSLAVSGEIHNVLLKYNSSGSLLWDYTSESMRYYNDFYIDGSDVCYIMNQVIVDPFPHRLSESNFPIASLITVNENGENIDEAFFIGPEYSEFIGKKLVPHSDDRLLLAGSVRNQAFFEGSYFFETQKDGSLGIPEELNPDVSHNSLGQNFPNPAHEFTVIPFTLVHGGKAVIKLYSSQGRLIKIIAADDYAPGSNTVEFNTKGLAPGIYFYQINSNGYKQARKLVKK
ncbi:T9SS type A sorting domain-containing protein [Formosa sp. A9]|uniref:T9SS type A sorting domain-containing protein n=1 Tax=Formosa sp. A9 TaxID=3442641 RepID=UPI003EBF8743